MDESHVAEDLIHILYTEEQLQGRLDELAREIERDYEGKEILLVGVLRGALHAPIEVTFDRAVLSAEGAHATFVLEGEAWVIEDPE